MIAINTILVQTIWKTTQKYIYCDFNIAWKASLAVTTVFLEHPRLHRICWKYKSWIISKLHFYYLIVCTLQTIRVLIFCPITFIMCIFSRPNQSSSHNDRRTICLSVQKQVISVYSKWVFKKNLPLSPCFSVYLSVCPKTCNYLLLQTSILSSIFPFS